MRYFDQEESDRIGAEQWQVDLLKMNPGYVTWGPHEDYMIVDKMGWDSRIIATTWAEFGPLPLDDLNECVNFYFSVNRESERCTTCDGDGYHPRAHPVVNTFYPHQCESVGIPASEAWNDKITQDEVQALVDRGRLFDFTHAHVPGKGWVARDPACAPTAAEVNERQRNRRSLGHDAINRHILIEARLKRLGIPSQCPTCRGHGEVFTGPPAHASLTLWWLHPRKGCSRGIEITRIERDDLPAIFAFLRQAAERNAQRFSAIPVAP